MRARARPPAFVIARRQHGRGDLTQMRLPRSLRSLAMTESPNDFGAFGRLLTRRCGRRSLAEGQMVSRERLELLFQLFPRRFERGAALGMTGAGDLFRDPGERELDGVPFRFSAGVVAPGGVRGGAPFVARRFLVRLEVFLVLTPAPRH